MKTIILPETKLNELAQQVSESMLSQQKIDSGIIRGDELKQFASHKQINKFLIFQVYQVWEMQINKLNHPYFNLEHPDITATLQSLKNQISQHIEVNEDDFRPMLERAVYNNIKLLVDPKASFHSFFFAQKDSLPIHVYQRFSQFFADMDFIVNSILRYYQKNEIGEVDKEVFFSKMEKVIQVYNRKSNKGFDAYRSELFEGITGRKLEEVIAEAEVEEEARLKQERLAEEARRKAEEAEKRKEEEARKQAEEAKRAEEQARLQAEAEAKRKAEEDARIKAEEEARLKAEEEKRKAEEEAKKVNFFDTISVSGDSFFDLDEEDEGESSMLDEEEEEEVVVEAPVDEPENQPADEDITEEEEIEVSPEEEEVEEQEEETAEETSLEEVQEEIDSQGEIEVEEETQVEEAVEETSSEEGEAETETEVAEEKEEEKVEVALDEEEFQEMANSMQPEEEEEETAPISILDKVSSQQSTATYLDKFLNSKSNGVAKEEVAEEVIEEVVEPIEEEVEETIVAEEPTPTIEEVVEETSASPAGETIFDRVVDKPKTIADQFQGNQTSPEPVHDTINGNRKIKLDEIPIHKQYQYVQKVFDGNNVRFRIIVDKVNNAKNKVEVEDILNKFVLSNESLDQADGVVSEFIGLLRNRF